jgi:hypothetical protein
MTDPALQELGGWRHRVGVGAVVMLSLLAILGFGAAAASAAAPGIGQVWASLVQPTTTRLSAEVDPGGKSSAYHFDYITKAAYDANLSSAKDGFTGAGKLPALADTFIPGTVPTIISPLLSNLMPGTAYRYRLVVSNADGSTTSPPRDFVTTSQTPFALPDDRGWEMVSPREKNGGQVDLPGAIAGGGVLQAAADGQSVTYSSDAAFFGGSQGAAPGSQYISSRASDGWSTLNLTPPLLAGSYGTGPAGVPYQLFSGDLSRGLLLNGRPCRGEEAECPVANPPLAGTDAPAGYQNYYLRESATGGFEALLGGADVAQLDADPANFAVTFAGASPDLRHAVLSTCAALTPNATEVPLGEGCDPAKPNLYKWSAGSLTLVNLLPAQGVGTPGAALGAQGAAVSADGSRVYWNDLATGNLYLRAGAQTKQVDVAAGGGGSFQTATVDGSVAFYIAAGHLWRYDAIADSSTDLTPAGGVLGALGASASASSVYYSTGSGVFLRQGATTTKVADAADPSNYPPTTGTARVSADGIRLVFVSTAPLTTSDGATFDNVGVNSKVPDSQVYLYDAAGAGTLICLSCNPTRGRPLGPSTIPGALANGTSPGSTSSYKPRVLSADGRRVFFDSEDALVPSDVNLNSDVYQWQAQGSGSCTRAGGCVALISSGLAGSSTFVDASSDGSDAFFLTDRSLVGSDPGSVDLYDARVGGGFPESTEPPLCIGDACQVVPPAPEDPVLTTVLAGPGNPSERYRSYGAKGRKCPDGKKQRTVRKNGKRVTKCVKMKRKKSKGDKRRSASARGARR